MAIALLETNPITALLPFSYVRSACRIVFGARLWSKCGRKRPAEARHQGTPFCIACETVIEAHCFLELPTRVGKTDASSYSLTRPEGSRHARAQERFETCRVNAAQGRTP